MRDDAGQGSRSDGKAEQSRAESGPRSRLAEPLRPIHDTLLGAYAAAARQAAGLGITLVSENDRDGEELRSYEALFRTSTRMAGALAARGVVRGERVLILLPTSFDFVTVFFAIQMLGAIPVPAYPPTSFRVKTGLERLYHIARHSGTRWCVTDGELLPVLDEMSARTKGVCRLVTIEELDGDPARESSATVSGEDLALIQYTSGSTGNPKGVVLTHRSLTANIHAIGQSVEVRPGDVVVSWLPLYHDMGLIGTLLFSIYWQLPLVMMSPRAFLARPSRWLRAIHRHRGTLSPAPNFAYQLCAKRKRVADCQGLDLSSWRVAFNGAEIVSHRTLDEFTQAFAPHGFQKRAFFPVYGLAEATLAVAFPAHGQIPREERIDRRALAAGRAVPTTASGEESLTLVSVGQAMPGHEVRVVDDTGHAYAERFVGHVIASGPSVMQGYDGDHEWTHAVLRDGWLWTGDLGCFADGQLFITGRAKDMIISRGDNYYAEDIERVAEGVDGVGAAVAFSVYDEQAAKESAVVICETARRTAEERGFLVDAVAAAVLESSGLKVDEVVLIGRGQLPRTSSGKKQRSLSRQTWQEGGFQPGGLTDGGEG